MVTPLSWNVDAAGNMLGDGLRDFVYDSSRRLSKVRVLQSGEAASVNYLHNALGERVFKSEPVADQTLPSAETLGQGFIDWLKNSFSWLFDQAQTTTSLGTAFVYDEDGNLLGEYDNGSASSTGRTQYVWLPVEGAQAIPIAMHRGGKLYPVHTDHLGTPRLMTSNTADHAPVWQWPYSAFGNNAATGPLAANTAWKGAVVRTADAYLTNTGSVQLKLRFPGQYHDDETGLRYNYFRSYMPGRCRKGQADRVGLGGGVNRFGYVGANPQTRTDRRGLQADPWMRRPQGPYSIPNPTADAQRDLARRMTAALDQLIDACKVVGSRVFNAGLPSGVWPADEGAAEWGRRNGVGAREGKGRFHGIKQSNRGRPREEYGVDPATGDVYDPAGDVIGNLDEVKSK